MNLDDLVLLRGWINHIEWTQLDSQLPEAGASLRQLALLNKSVFSVFNLVIWHFLEFIITITTRHALQT